MSGILSELSEAFATLVEEAGKSVVRVNGRRGRASSGIVWSENGTIIAANHCIEWEEAIEVGLPDGQSQQAALIGRDPTTDLAVIQVAAGGQLPAQWLSPETLRVGSLAVSLARPGRNLRASMGMIRALGDAWYTRAGGRVDSFLETDLRPFPGYSGSLLVDVHGRALGINTAGLRRGASLALPAPTVRRVVEALAAHGRVRRGFLGVSTYPVRLPTALAGELEQRSGLLVVSVQPKSPAAEAGLVLGDVLVAVDGHPLQTPMDLLSYLGEDRIGAEAILRILRVGDLRDVPVRFGARDEAEAR